MKAIIFILGVLFLTNTNAQKFDCSSKINEYQELFKAKKIAETFESWSEARKNCSTTNETIYTDGVEIIQYKIDNAVSAEEKEALVRDLLKVYDQYNKNFPLNTAGFEVSKAMALHDNNIDAKEEIFNLLENGFSKAPESISSANAIYIYFSMYCDTYTAGNKKITSNALLEKYTLVNSMLTQLQVSNPAKIEEYKTAQKAIGSLVKDIATCEKLEDYYNQNFAANQDNKDWLLASLNSLSAKCSAKSIFNTMAEKLYSIKATAQSANFMGLGSLKQRKFTEAIKFYNESADLQSNPLEKAKIYYMLATGLSANDISKAKAYVNQSLSFDPKMGKSYLYLAQLYSNSAKDCGKTEFEKKAIYYLAIETAKKAGVVEPMLKATSDKMAKDYAALSFTNEEIKRTKMNGKTITIGCWINETITFPSK